MKSASVPFSDAIEMMMEDRTVPRFSVFRADLGDFDNPTLVALFETFEQAEVAAQVLSVLAADQYDDAEDQMRSPMFKVVTDNAFDGRGDGRVDVNYGFMYPAVEMLMAANKQFKEIEKIYSSDPFGLKD